MIRRLLLCAVALSLAGCGAPLMQHSTPVPERSATAAAPTQAPPKPASLTGTPKAPTAAVPALPSNVASLRVPQLTADQVRAMHPQPQAESRRPAGHSTGFFANEVYVGNDASGYAVYYLAYFGYYTYVSTTPGARPYDGWLYKYGFGWLYDLGGSYPGAPDVYFYDLDLNFFYTANGFGSDATNYLYLYHFGTGHFMVYFQSFSLPRYFYDYDTGSFFKTPPAIKVATGDMMALAASKGWNYQTAAGGGITLSTYVNPSPLSDGSLVYAGSAVAGYVPTVLTSYANAENNAVGALALSNLADGWHVSREVSAGSVALVPGNPLLIGNSLIAGAVSFPYPGMTQTVVNVGPQPGETACGTNRDGALVQYSFNNSVPYTISYVPGCGITQLVAPSGSTFTLQSMGTYGTLGNLSKGRRVESANVATTVLSIFGRGKQDMPAAALIK